MSIRECYATRMKMQNVFCLLALAACAPSEGKRAEGAYEIADSRQDRCDMARKVERAYLEDGDAENYSKWKSTAAMDCLYASIAR